MIANWLPTSRLGGTVRRHAQRPPHPLMIAGSPRHALALRRARLLAQAHWREVTLVTAATRDCPEMVMRLPGGGHEDYPLTVMGFVRHVVVCLAASHG
jgi:hypothetical protein